MHLPRWTVYPALALIALMLVMAFPEPHQDDFRGAASSARKAVRTPLLPPPPASAAVQGAVVHAADYLPADFPRDGSRDATRHLQAALEDAVGGQLLLPPYPLLVSAAPGRRWCLRVPGTVEIAGVPGSLLVEREGAVQILRAERIDGLVLRGFGVRGIETAGRGLAHGLVQVTYGADVLIQGLRIESSDADGIAIAGVRNARVVGCTVRGAAKSGIYLSDCDGGVVRDNLVEDFGGHTTSNGSSAGAGIQISSSREVLCTGNLIRNGSGMGILCNAGQGRPAPFANTITGNRIHGVSNRTNRNASSGIHCANSSPNRKTNTQVTDNSIQDCGLHGIYLSMHSGSRVSGNTIAESERSGIVISACTDVELRENVIWNSDIAELGGQAGIYLLNGSSGVRVRDNRIENSGLYRSARGFEGVIDACEAGANEVHAEDRVAAQPPASGRHLRGERVWNSAPRSGAALGWVCTDAGLPGTWAAFGQIE